MKIDDKEFHKELQHLIDMLKGENAKYYVLGRLDSLKWVLKLSEKAEVNP